ncbi:uncharacterized protein tespa1 [Aulostomus maculatus]
MMESSSSTERRRAWINSSRHWPTLEELDRDGPSCNLASASVADDDVFAEGCLTGKIEHWLQDCGLEAQNTGHRSFESVWKANSFDDELSLGADASALHGGGYPHTRQSSTRRQKLCLPSLNMGHSANSSFLSSTTCKTTSSVSEVLQLCSEDVEETLYELGFGQDEPQFTVRIPPRFFTFPSQAEGINFRLFLDSQLRRIREEDPSLSIASRFRQVQVLTAMANAFYSLYSHVSRTPLQKLTTPEFIFTSSPMERMERFRSLRSEPRSPVERLKDTVSKMCLYTGSPCESVSTSPQSSPRKRSSLSDVAGIVLSKVKSEAGKKLDWRENSRNVAVTDDTEDAGRKDFDQEMQDRKQKQVVDANKNSIQSEDLDSVTSLSGETVIETDHQVLLWQSDLDSWSTQSDTTTADLKPVAKLTYDLISPPIVESVHQAPFCCRHKPCMKANTSPHTSSGTDRSCGGSHGPLIQHRTHKSVVSDKDSLTGSGHGVSSEETTSLPVLGPNGNYTHYSITVSGWEGDETSYLPQASEVQPGQTCEDSFSQEKSQYLNPLTHHQALGTNYSNLQPVNSFELEEVHSAGEDDSGQAETTRTTSPPSRKQQNKSEVGRSNSQQSDSSGYVDEDASPLSDKQN